MLFRRNWIFLALSALTLALAGAAAACGGDDDNLGGGAATATATAANNETPAGDGDDTDSLDGTTFQINKKFWHSGFEVLLEKGTIEAEKDVFGDVKGYQLTIEGTFKNLGDDTTFFGPDVAIVQGTKNYVSSFGYDPPTAGSGLTTEGQVAFKIDDGFDYTKAKLVIGSGDEVRAEIPFGTAAGELVALEPEEPPVTGMISLDLVDIEITGAQLPLRQAGLVRRSG